MLTLAGCGGRQSAAPQIPAANTPQEGPSDFAYYEYLPETSPAGQPQQTPQEDPAVKAAREAAEREAQLRQLVNEMSLEEKVGQLFFVNCPTDAAKKIAQYHLGGVLLFTDDYQNALGGWLSREDFVAKIQSYQDAAAADTGIPLFIGSDEEGGTVTRASRNPNLFAEKSKSPQELYAEGGMGAVLNDTMQKNSTLRALGINVNFAPVCDVSTNRNDFMFARSFGLDAEQTADYVARVVLAMGDADMGSVLKHFPGYGNNADTHTGIAIDERPIERFRQQDFLPFRAGIAAGGKVTPMVLVSHNIVNCMDAELPASLSPAVHQILRDELGFDGVVLTDDLAMDAVKAYANDGSVAVLALLAGNDMIVTADFETQIPQVINAVMDGRISEERVNLACLRVLRAKAERFAAPLSLDGGD